MGKEKPQFLEMDQMRTFAPKGKEKTSVPRDAPRDGPKDENEEDPLLPGKKGLCS